MPIPRGTRQLVELGEVAKRLGTSRETVRFWWKTGRLLGRHTQGRSRKRVTVPIEVVEFYLRYFRLPTRLDLYEAGALSRSFLLELRGPDGGLCDVIEEQDAAAAAAATGAASESGRLLLLPSP
jgi:hypothetical protein